MKTLEIAFRLGAGLVVAWLGFLFFATFTTDGWYFTTGWWVRSIRTVIVGTVIGFVVMAPLSWLPFVGRPWRRVLAGMVCVSFFSVVCAEFLARAQEWVALRTYGLTPSEPILIDRWWPFDHHTIAFYPGSGWCGWD